MDKIFVIGDVHGCLYTLKELLKHWDKETEQLIFVGDLIDRGNFSPETVQLVKQLVNEEDAVCLMGNHEYACIKAILINDEKDWFKGMGATVLEQYKKAGFRIKNDAKWFDELPLIWQSEKFVISHAGIAKNIANPLDKTDTDSVLWTRNPLKNIEGKIQIHGHTPHFENPVYNDESNSWNIDSACVYDYFLTGIKFHINGTFISKHKIITLKKDLPRKFELSE